MRSAGWLRDSVTYQAILTEGRDEGRAESVHDLLLEFDSLRFGPPDRQTRASLDLIAQALTTREAARRQVDATSWADLVAPAEG
jgi:hypothetical protein